MTWLLQIKKPLSQVLSPMLNHMKVIGSHRYRHTYTQHSIEPVFTSWFEGTFDEKLRRNKYLSEYRIIIVVVSTWVVVGGAVLQDALEDRALAHVRGPVHPDRDIGICPVRLSQGNARERGQCRVLAGDRAERGGTLLLRITAVAFLFALHSVVEGRANNSTALPILDHGDHNAQ